VATIDIDRDAAHEAAQRELAKPIYPRGSLSQRFSDWIDDLLYRVALKGSEIPGGWFTIAILLIVFAVGVVVAIRVARHTMRTNRGSDQQLFGLTELTAAQHRSTAEHYAGKDDWTAAIRHRLRAVARQLEETGVLNAVPGRTANELARDAGAALPLLASELTRAASIFNDVTYGELPGTPAGYRVVADLDDHLQSYSPATPSAEPQSAMAESWVHVR